MKSFSLILILMLFVGIYVGIRFNSQEERVLRIGAECDYSPQNWEESDSTVTNVPISNKEGAYAEGYDIQIARRVAESIGAKLEVKKIEWANLLPALNANEIDAVFSAMLDTDERRKLADFSVTYELHKTVYALLVNKKSKYASGKRMSDFSGAKIISQAGTNLDTVIDQIPGVIHVEPVADIYAMLDKVLSDDVDGMVVDLDSGRIYEKNHPELIEIVFPEGEGFKVGFTGVCAAVRKSDQTLLSEINRAISQITSEERARIMDFVIAREREGR